MSALRMAVSFIYCSLLWGRLGERVRLRQVCERERNVWRETVTVLKCERDVFVWRTHTLLQQFAGSAGTCGSVPVSPAAVYYRL